MRRDILVRGWSQCTWRLGSLEASVVLTVLAHTTEEPLRRKLWDVADLAGMRWIATSQLANRPKQTMPLPDGNKKLGKLQ